MIDSQWQDRSDEELLALACREVGSAEARRAASSLLQRYHVRVFQWCNAQLEDPDLASDVAQEVLLKAYHSLGSFAGRARFSSWLFAITRNRCLDELRRPRRLVEVDAIEELIAPEASPAVAYEVKAARSEWLDLLARHLEPDEQAAMVLRYFECMPIAEITRILGLTQASGARGLLQAAKRKLRRILAAEGRIDHD